MKRKRFNDVLFPEVVEVKEINEIISPLLLDIKKKELWVDGKKEAESSRVFGQAGYSPIWWDYKQYLSDFYDYYIAKGKVVEPLSVDEFARQRQKFIDGEKEKIQEETQRRIDNSRVKLTNAERYLAVATGIRRQFVIIDNNYSERDKTPAEIRQAIKAMRKRKNYADLVKFNKELKTISETGLKGLYDLVIANYGYIKLVWQANSPLGKFIIAEDKIKGLSESEIEKLAILEAI